MINKNVIELTISDNVTTMTAAVKGFSHTVSETGCSLAPLIVAATYPVQYNYITQITSSSK